MARILCFDTATKSCTVGVSIDGRAEAIVESLDEGYSHSEKLHGYIEEAMKQANLKMADLDAVAVGKGPGSYTGLRIGVSSAKGFAYALNIPIISIDTLQAMAAQCSEQIGNDDLLAPMLDARRMEVYTAFYNKRLQSVTDISAEIIDEESYSTALQKQVIHFFGNGMEKCREVLSAHENARFIADIEPMAKSMMDLAEKKFLAGQFEDTAYFEPFYLKEFMATVPKKLL